MNLLLHTFLFLQILAYIADRRGFLSLSLLIWLGGGLRINHTVIDIYWVSGLLLWDLQRLLNIDLNWVFLLVVKLWYGFKLHFTLTCLFLLLGALVILGLDKALRRDVNSDIREINLGGMRVIIPLGSICVTRERVDTDDDLASYWRG